VVQTIDDGVQRRPADLLGEAKGLADGRRDEVVSRRSLVALYRAASEPKRIGWYDAGHTLNAKAVDDQLAWLQSELR